MNWYVAVLKKYAVFNGRARRKEYWMFVLVHVAVMVALGILAGVTGMAGGIGESLLVNIYVLAVLVPSVAAGVRRMHDTGHSGWWVLMPLVNLLFAVREGDARENEYGPDPKASERSGVAAAG